MFDLPFYLAPVAAHKETKDAVLREIELLCQDSRCFNPTAKERVHSDYLIGDEASASSYKNQVIDTVMPNIDAFGVKMGAKALELGQIWFQRYETDAFHGIHNHWPSLFSVVYFLEFDPSEHDATVFISPNQLQVELYRTRNIDLAINLSPNVKEGDILIFPSFVDHYAPINRSEKPRTIISFNFDMNG